MWMVVLQMGVIFQGGEISTTITVIVGVWGPPDLPLLDCSGALVLVAEVMQSTSTVTPLLLVGRPSRFTIRETAVVTPAPHKGLMMMGKVAPASTWHSPCGPSLGTKRRWWGLVGRTRGRAGGNIKLLNGTCSPISQSNRRCITPEEREK